MVVRSKKEKCLSCHHPLEEHTANMCLHWHNDLKRLCRCQDGSDGVVLNKSYAGVKVVEIISVGSNHVWFTDPDGNHWRWLFSYKKIFPIEFVI